MKNVPSIKKHLLCLLIALMTGIPTLHAVKFQSGDFIFDCNYFWGTLSATLLQYVGNDETVIVPESVLFDGNTYPTRYIGDDFSRPFMGNTKVRSVSLPSGAIGIGTEAFSGCSSLEQIDLGENMRDLSALSFFGCSHLSKVMIHNVLAHIGDYAFAHCDSLTELTLGRQVSRLGEFVFDHTPLHSLTLLNATPATCDGALSSNSTLYSQCKLYVRIGSLAKYLQSDDEWRKFRFIEERAEYGDINHDGFIDVADINILINSMLGKNMSGSVTTHDLDNDGSVDVSDINILINILLGKYVFQQ